MNEIKAFVGHSFSSDDTAIVGCFLKYFDQLKGLYPIFSWEHAEAAEPRELAEKVLSLVAGKNLFIGICTKKERVIAPKQLEPLLLQRLYRKAKETEFHWKTSDWIIQEIGLAIGRGLDVILLVEDGLRPPGGLQGNVEYISFTRETPEKSFGKIVEMIRALSPRPAQISAAAADIMPMQTINNEQPLGKEVDWAKPKPDWALQDYKRAMFFLTVRDRPDDAAIIDAAYLASEDAKIGDHTSEWEANAEYIRIRFGKGGSLNKLKDIAAAQTKNRDILFYLAMSQDYYGNHQEAAATIEVAASVAHDEADKNTLLGFAAAWRAENGDTVAALAMIDTLRLAASIDPKMERGVLDTIRQVADITKNNDLAISMMERIVAISPDDSEVRFSLAYKHSEMGNEDLALHHYLKIPFEKRNSTTWNNLGVSFDHFSMPAKAVHAYRFAEEAKETLAMSNLGQKFLNAGFLAEAQAEFDKALKIPDYHKNIGLGLTRLREASDEENKKKEEVLAAAKQKIDFYRLLGKAGSQTRPKALGTHWHGPDCELTASFSDGKFRAVGIYERGANGLLTGLMPGLGHVTKYRVEYEGVVMGRQLEGTVRRVREGESSSASTILGLNDTRSKVLMAICDDGILKVMEAPHSANPTFYEIRPLLPKTSAPQPQQISVGDRVFHQKFGYGRVTFIEDNKLSVDFDKAGEKKVIDTFVQKV